MDKKAEPLALNKTDSVEHTGVIERSVLVWPNEAGQNQSDLVAQEKAIALVYNGVSHAVMMASPLDLEQFALGFSFTEDIIESANEIYAIDISEQENGITIDIKISNRRFLQLKKQRRNLTGRSGCGICGTESLEQIRTVIKPIKTDISLSHDVINAATSNFTTHQFLQKLTGAVHGAAWCDKSGNIVKVCEDVGRHNALDKLIGFLWTENSLQSPGFLLMSSRASYEIIQKAAKAGIAIVAAMSAPTSFAIDIADQAGITLIGFSRENRHVVYTHNERLTDGNS